jgi:ribosomal protein L11 methyltransferase
MNSDSLIKVSLPVKAEFTDLIEGYIFEISPSPWVIVENSLSKDSTLIGFFQNAKIWEEAKTDLMLNIPNIQLDCCVHLEIKNEDWKDSYKAHFQPWKYKEFHLIPSWMKKDYALPTDHLSLLLDPGMAFGTGNHETTRMCLEFLIDAPTPNSSQYKGSLLDLGCGSGILSLAASLLNYGPVIGLDNDEDSVRISRENAAINQLADKVTFKVADLCKLDAEIGKFDCIVANIQADVLISNAQIILSLANFQSTIILAGILANEIEDVVEIFNDHLPENSFELTIKEMGEWASVKFIRSA